MNQPEEPSTPSYSEETKSRFKRLRLLFRQQKKPSIKDPSETSKPFYSFFDGKSSLFSKKTPKQETPPEKPEPVVEPETPPEKPESVVEPETPSTLAEMPEPVGKPQTAASTPAEMPDTIMTHAEKPDTGSTGSEKPDTASTIAAEPHSDSKSAENTQSCLDENESGWTVVSL